MELEHAAKRKLIVKAYEQLSSKSKLSDTGEYLGLWGYLHKKQNLKKSQVLPNEQRGLITCSKEDYMQLYLKSKRKKSMLSQVPVQTTTNLSIDLSRSNDNTLPSLNSKTEDVLKNKESSQKTIEKPQVVVADLRLNGQLIKSEKKSHLKSHSKKHTNKKEPESLEEKPDKKEKKRKVKKERILDNLETPISPQEVHYYLYSADADPDNLGNPLIVVADDTSPSICANDDSNAGVLLKLGSESQLSSSKYSQSFNYSRRQSNMDHGIFTKVRNAARFSLPVRDKMHTSRSSISVGSSNDSRNQLSWGSQIETIAKVNTELNEKRKSKNDLVSTESNLDHGIFTKVRNAARFSISVRDKMDTSRFSKSIGGSSDSRNKLRTGSLLETVQKDNTDLDDTRKSNSDITNRRKSLKGGEHLNESMGRRKSLKGDHLLGNLGRRKSIKESEDAYFESRRRSILLHETFNEEEFENADNLQSMTAVSQPPAPLAPLLGPVRVKELWFWAFCSILRSNKMQNVGALNQKITFADRTESERKFTAAYDQKTIQNVIQIINVFHKKRELQSDDEFAALNSILGVTPFFSKFPQDLRPRLYKEVHFATYSKGKKLIKEANQAECCYILIVGEIIQVSESSVSRINELGNTVGEFLSATPSEPRNYSATCLMRTSVAYVPKQVWLKYTREAKQYEAYQLDALSNVKFFRNYPKSDLIKICARGYIRYFNPVTFILKSGEPTDSMYFIIKGKVQILHLFEFVKSIDHFIDRTYMISAYNGNSVNNGDELVKELGIISELVPGNFFPPIASTPTLHQSVLNPWSYLSGDNTVEVFVIPKSDLLEVISESLLTNLKTVSFFPTRETLVLAQDRYLFLHGWADALNDSHISERIANEISKRNVTFENFKLWGA